jgi:hypothetical protein
MEGYKSILKQAYQRGDKETLKKFSRNDEVLIKFCIRVINEL